MFALIVEGQVWELFKAEPHLAEGNDVRDVSKVKGIAVGWVANANGTYSAPPPVVSAPISGPRVTFKADLYRRTTEEEAEAIETSLMAVSVKQRRLFESAAYLGHDDDLFATMHTALVEMFGEARADELLAAS